MKPRNMRSEGKYNFLLNCAVLFIAAALFWLVMPEHGPIGARSMLFLNLIYICGIMAFMWALEKYSALISGMREKAVSTILSAIYTFVVMCAINLILFSELARLVYDAAFALVSVLLVCCIDALAERFYKKRYRQPRLLIIDTDPTNISRTKRIKYGVLKKYDSWYENIEGKTSEEFVEFVNDQFPLFDAICVLNGFRRFEYRVAVNTAVKMNKDLFIVPDG